MVYIIEGKLRPRRSDLEPFTILDTMGRANKDPELVRLLAGEPGDPVPEAVMDSIRREWDGVLKGYPSPWGEATFVERYIAHANEHYGTDLKMGDVFFLPGSSLGIEKALQFACEHGDKALLPYPAYKGYVNNAQLTGARLVHAYMDEASGFIMTPEIIDEAVSAHPDLKLVFIIDPNNPNAASMTNAQMHAVMDRCAHYGLIVVADEAYLKMVREGERRDSIMVRKDVRSIVLDTTSKYWLAPWARIAVMKTQDPQFKASMKTAALSTILGGPPPIQRGLCEMFNHTAYYDAMSEANGPKADLVEKMLIAAGMVKPGDPLGKATRATFYRYVPVEAFIQHLNDRHALMAQGVDLRSDDLINLGIKFEKVAMSGGSDYIPSALPDEIRRQQDALRISYSESTPVLEEGLRRAHHFFTEGIHELLDRRDVLMDLRLATEQRRELVL
ncbi:MAG: aminotransferase class I/II-fold pyridoxal phosphate-dependent enzyme [Alphaproteobacteria bacterium]|nr:aminotransferase class I/II-fold pyridoxal phosphate-dependent enzyme [Alphaproteobacteria bacterium]